MAYLNYLASVPAAELAALRADATVVLHPSYSVAVSHLIASCIQVQPLGRLLGQAIDQGIALHVGLWHPLRAPVYHPPDEVQALFEQMNQAWQQTQASHPVPADDWYRIEIEKVLRAFRHALESEECIVSILQKPADSERADRVRIPFAR